MPKIGDTLREARMRAKIDVSEVEAATKIRAKYLRALENEEWGLLPGPTFVRSFLRTYAEYLGLDSRMLVEEYRSRYERPSELDLAPIAPSLGPEPRRLRAPRLSRGWIVGLALVGIVALLIVIGSLGGGGGPADNGGGVATQKRAPKRPAQRRGATTPAPAPTPTVARLQIRPTGDVYVCLQDSAGHLLIPGVILSAGQDTRTYHGKRFRVTLGNGAVDLRVNGRRMGVPDTSTAIGYEVTPKGRHVLPQASLPTCQ